MAEEKADDKSGEQVQCTPQDWGSINKVLNARLIDVPRDAWWISVIFMWLTLPWNLIQGILAGLIQSIFVCVSIGSCCCGGMCSAMGSVLRGRPLWLAFTWWRYVIGGLTALLKQGKSRLSLFMWEWAAFGKGEWWWHGEGVWLWSYQECERVLKSEQPRKPAFGAVRACIPDLFAAELLIFLPNGGKETEWWAIRNALHTCFLDDGCGSDYRKRLALLPEQLENDPNTPKSMKGLNDVLKVQKAVCKCMFFMFFNQWLNEDEAKILTGWRTNALFFVLPRLVQRFLFNIGIRKIKKLRRDTVGIIEKRDLKEIFCKMNETLGKWKRTPVVKLCDEIMYAVGFAGIGGTCAACESIACFLQNKIPPESAAEHIKWGEYSTSEKMVEKYKENPEKYIRETCRMDPPVTSATSALSELTTIKLKGREYKIPAGTLNQYVLSMANRDKSRFSEPEVFNPDRPNLNDAFTWNGRFGAGDEDSFPRICPGRHLSLAITTAVINHAVGHKEGPGTGPAVDA